MAHTRAWDETKPANTDLASSLGTQGRTLRVDIRERMQLQHTWGVNTDRDGMHKNILFDVPAVAPNLPLIDAQGHTLDGANDQPALHIGGTWNTTGLPHLIRGNVVVTAANPASRLISLQNNGVEKFGVDINGNAQFAGSITSANASQRTGEIVMTAAHQPANTLYCDGAAVSRATYAALFAVIGASYGAGDGSTTFNVPNLQGRLPLAHGNGPGLTPRSIGQQGGEEAVALTEGHLAPHTHGVTDGLHAHLYDSLQPGGVGSDFPLPGQGSAGAFRQAATDNRPSNISINSAGSGVPHDNMPPFAVLYFWIHT